MADIPGRPARLSRTRMCGALAQVAMQRQGGLPWITMQALSAKGWEFQNVELAPFKSLLLVTRRTSDG